MVQIKISLERKDHAAQEVPQTPAAALKADVAQYSARKRKSLIASVIIVAALGGAGWWTYAHHKKFSAPFPKSIRQSVSYQLFYPKILPAGYSYKPNSATLADSGVLFYRLTTASGQTVSISEQTKPTTQLALSSLVGYSPLQGAIGQGVIGSQNNQPSALLETQQTLISISGTQDVPSNVVSSIAKNLQQVD